MRGQKRPTADRTRALGIAVVDGAAAASRETGVPENTIRTWMDSPEFVELRTRKQEAVEEEWWGFVQKGFRRTADLLDSTDDAQKAATATAIIYDKLALSRGQATSRSETKDITSDLPADIKRDLRSRFADSVRSSSSAVETQGEAQPATTRG